MPFTISVDVLKSNTYNKLTPSYFPIEESYFSSTLKFIGEMKQEYRNTSIKLYKSLNEANNQIAINESFSDFLSSIRDIIRKVIDYIKRLFDRFVIGLNNIIKSDKYLKNHKDEFRKFSTNMEFDMNIYNFTITSAIPSCNVQTTFDKEFDEIKNILIESGKNEIDPEKIANKLKAEYNKYSDSLEDKLDDCRSEIINAVGGISSGDYAEELFNTYRDGGDTSTETITTSIVSNCYIRFSNYEDELKKIKKTKSNLEKEYSDIERKLKNSYIIDPNKHIKIGSDTSGYTMGVVATADMENTMQLFMKAKADEIITLSGIHIMALSAKMDAMSDCFKQDKIILYKALSKIKKKGDK